MNTIRPEDLDEPGEGSKVSLVAFITNLYYIKPNNIPFISPKRVRKEPAEFVIRVLNSIKGFLSEWWFISGKI